MRSAFFGAAVLGGLLGGLLGGVLGAGAGMAQDLGPGRAGALGVAPAAVEGATQDQLGRDPLKGVMTPRIIPTTPSPEAKSCADPGAAPNLRADACSTLISSGKWQGEQIAWAYANRCVALFKLNRRDKAGADCDKALELDPKNLVARQVRGMMARDRGDDERALSDFDAAAGYGSKNAALFLDRGNILLARGDVARALADIEQAVGLNPDSAAVYVARANARLAAGDFSGALADGAQAEQLAAASEPAAFTHGVAAALAGDSATAVAALRRAQALAPKDPYPTLWLSLVGEPARDGLQAIGEKPDAPWPAPVARYDLGALDREQLLAAAQKPAERCEAQFYLGAALLNASEPEAASLALSQAVELCPKNFIEYAGASAKLKKLSPAQPEPAKPDAAAK